MQSILSPLLMFAPMKKWIIWTKFAPNISMYPDDEPVFSLLRGMAKPYSNKYWLKDRNQCAPWKLKLYVIRLRLKESSHIFLKRLSYVQGLCTKNTQIKTQIAPKTTPSTQNLRISWSRIIIGKISLVRISFKFRILSFLI